MSGSDAEEPLVINGWTIFAHPLFLDQISVLAEKVKRLRTRDAEGYKKKNATKRLAAIVKLAFEDIPANPANTAFRQGKTLGDDYKHWFRAKFFQQYRLFFRHHMESKVIVYGWVNDDKTLRAYGSRSDAYEVFKGMLDDGRPPDSWDSLLHEAKEADANLKKAVSTD